MGDFMVLEEQRPTQEEVFSDYKKRKDMHKMKHALRDVTESQKYLVNCSIDLIGIRRAKPYGKLKARAKVVSDTGILVELVDDTYKEELKANRRNIYFQIKFIMESPKAAKELKYKVKDESKLIRVVSADETHGILLEFQFTYPISKHINNKSGKSISFIIKEEKPDQEDVFPVYKKDRRVLPNVPDKEKIRSSADRRGTYTVLSKNINRMKHVGGQSMENKRYLVNYDVELKGVRRAQSFRKIKGKARDVSNTGILVELAHNTYSKEELKINKRNGYFQIKFKIEPGTMPEGFEYKIKEEARLIRVVPADENHGLLLAFQFVNPISNHIYNATGKSSLFLSSLFLFFVSACVLFMRAESFIYFKYNKFLYLYSIITAVFLLSRYLFGALYRVVTVNPDFTPGVSIVIPCFNEEEWISTTILSCMNQDYPIDKLEVIVVDDCSNDNSVKKIQETIEKLYSEAERFQTKERIQLIVQEKNAGKREALARGVEVAENELVVFVDSDSFLEPDAIRNLVQPFQDPKVGGVTGRTEVENKYTNYLTKMQAVRYYIAFRIMKAAEAYFDAVTCLSGPLSCYRRRLVLKHKETWLKQKFLGQPATFGDDRSLTNLILRTHRTEYQDSAICSTIVPNKYSVFLKQQMRWKRSWLRESIIAGSFIFKKEPFMSLFFYMGLLVPIAAPIVVVYNLIYVPITHRIFPTTFLMGMLLMSLLISFAHLFFKRSTLWLFGLYFCLFYEVVLLWQMPVAWVTFWKSTWGTRMTPQDIKANEKKKMQKRKRYAKLDKKEEMNESMKKDIKKEMKEEIKEAMEELIEEEMKKSVNF
jgi:hyaluronan synthase